jgi:hypothetical protein
MKRLLFVMGAALLFVTAGAGAAETWNDVPLVDTMCATKVKSAPDAHTRACAIQCEKSGYGIIAADGAYFSFDEAGNTKAIAALKAAKKADHLRVSVAGERKGDTIKVASIRLN